MLMRMQCSRSSRTGRGSALHHAARQRSGSTLADSFRLLGLESWAQYYGDTVFDRFTSSGYFDTAINTVPNPFQDDTRFDALAPTDEISPNGFSILLQGVLLDPLAVASRQRSLNFFRAPFLERQATLVLLARHVSRRLGPLV